MNAAQRKKLDEELTRTVRTVAKGFFVPALRRLDRLMQHPHFGVRTFSLHLAVDFAIHHLSMFTTEMIADVAFRLQMVLENDPNKHVRDTAKEQLTRLLDAVTEFGAALKAAKQQASEPFSAN